MHNSGNTLNGRGEGRKTVYLNSTLLSQTKAAAALAGKWIESLGKE
jgi:hypothetical protein